MDLKKCMFITFAVISSTKALYEAHQGIVAQQYELSPQSKQQSVPLYYTHQKEVQAASVHVEKQPIIYAHHRVEESEHHAPAHYSFEYGVHDPHTGDIKSHKETRNGDTVQGYYKLLDADGRHRTVEYTADKHNGFNAVVTFDGKQHHPSGGSTHQQHYTGISDQKYIQPIAQKYVQSIGVVPVQKYELPIQKYEIPVQKYDVPVQKYEVPTQKYEVPVQKYEVPIQAYVAPSTHKYSEVPVHGYSNEPITLQKYQAPSIIQQKFLVSGHDNNHKGDLAHSYIYASYPTDSSEVHGANHHTTSQASHSISTQITHIIPVHSSHH